MCVCRVEYNIAALACVRLVFRKYGVLLFFMKRFSTRFECVEGFGVAFKGVRFKKSSYAARDSSVAKLSFTSTRYRSLMGHMKPLVSQITFHVHLGNLSTFVVLQTIANHFRRIFKHFSQFSR